MLFILVKITITATATIMVFVEILLEILAAIGDASALPITNPATGSQLLTRSIYIKVT